MFLFLNPISRHNHDATLQGMLALFAMGYGFGYGATFNALYSMPSRIFDLSGLGRTQSALFGMGLVGNALGSAVGGTLRSKLGSYTMTFSLCVVACACNVVVLWVLRRTSAHLFNDSSEVEASKHPPQLKGMLCRSNTFSDLVEIGWLGVSMEPGSVNPRPPAANFDD